MRFVSPALLRRGLPVALLLLAATLALWVGLWLRSVRGGGATTATPPGLQVTVTFCNVGSGEADWIKTPHGKFIIVGTGPPGSDAVLTSSLKSAGAKKIDLVFLPYPYAEAIGGTGGILTTFPVAQVCEPTPANTAPVNQWHKRARTLCKEKNIPLQTVWAGQVLTLDGVSVEVLGPAKIPLAVSPSGANNSLVLRVRWRKTAFLLAGGVERAGEDALLSRMAPLQADVLRVARMGTREASSPEFLRQVEPRFVVISAGVGGTHEETLRRLAATGAAIWQTGETAQNLVFQSDGVRVETSPGDKGTSGILRVQ